MQETHNPLDNFRQERIGNLIDCSDSAADQIILIIFLLHDVLSILSFTFKMTGENIGWPPYNHKILSSVIVCIINSLWLDNEDNKQTCLPTMYPYRYRH